METYPSIVPSWIAGAEVVSGREAFEKRDPATGETLGAVSPAGPDELERAIVAAQAAFVQWSLVPVTERAAIIARVGELLRARTDDAKAIVRAECGRPDRELGGEVGSAVAAAEFFVGLAGEFEPQPLRSSNPQRQVSVVRAPVGVGALFVPFNTPLAQIAAKTFPALLCGNAVILKAHELTPYIAVWFASILKEAGVPDGVFNVLQGTGAGIGEPLVRHPSVAFISFTGSSATGAHIVAASADRLAKVSIEGGGKNPFVVCADADLTKAVADASASVMVDNGQRCAATSRIIVFDEAYEQFKAMLVEKLTALTVGSELTADVGALISEERLGAVLAAVEGARARGAVLVCGGERIGERGSFMQPTLLENVPVSDPIAHQELFGPVAVLFRVSSLDEAIAIANDSSYRLSSAIHTKDMALAETFAVGHNSGVVRVNGPTFGSEPHMPFGGPGRSGNGWREPGKTALDFYSDLRQRSVDIIS